MTRFVEQLIDAHREGEVFPPQGPIPMNAAEAYVCHDALMAAIGPPGGYKLVRLVEGGLAVAPIPISRCLPTGGAAKVPESVGVELEVGFVVMAPPPDPEAADYREKLAAAVRPAPMIELIASRLNGAAARAPFAKLADLQSSAGLVHGPPHVDWDGSDFDAVEISMAAVDGTIAAGPARVPGGSALDALDAAARILSARGHGLRPGQFVLTGTLHPLTFVTAGQAVAGRIAGLGEVSVTLDARTGS